MGACEILGAAAMGMGIAGLVAYTFYRSVIAFLLLSPFALLFVWYWGRLLGEKRRKRLRSEFKEGITLLAASLQAGYSLENAIGQSAAELKDMFGEDSLMAGEFGYIHGQIGQNRQAEELIRAFGERSALKDVVTFANVLALAKRSQGELVPIIRHTAQVIGDTIRVEEEIETVTAAKRMEQKVMACIPFGIVLYLNAASGDFFSVMYEGAAGRILMSVFLGLYVLAQVLAVKILDIEV
jgi:tight adherence protein B